MTAGLRASGSVWIVAWAWLCMLAATGLVHAGPAEAAADARQAFAEAEAAARRGPAEIALAGQGRLQLPAGHLFVPQPQAARLLLAMGNPGRDERLLGLIFPVGEAGWFMTVRFEDSGYIKDDDARDWKVDELLQSYRDGTEAANEERLKMGVPAIEILGWAERPAYDGRTHRLVWALSSRVKGSLAGEPQGVNYNTYVLGREGYFSLNLITALPQLDSHRPAAQQMLAALTFDDGKRYQDFDASTDRVAEYGLAALVVGAAAKKLGAFALLGVFVAKFGKFIVLGLALVGGVAGRIFRRRRSPG